MNEANEVRIPNQLANDYTAFREGFKAAFSQKGIEACTRVDERGRLAWQLGWLRAIDQTYTSKHKSQSVS